MLTGGRPARRGSPARSVTGAATATAPAARTTPAASASASNSARCPSGYDHKYVYTHIGYNLKVTDMQAAVGVAPACQAGTASSSAARRTSENCTPCLSPIRTGCILPRATAQLGPVLVRLRDHGAGRLPAFPAMT